MISSFTYKCEIPTGELAEPYRGRRICDATIQATPGRLYRIRTFYNYAGESDYYRASLPMCGLYAGFIDPDSRVDGREVKEFRYDDWNCTIRAPRIDDPPMLRVTPKKATSMNFNTEIIVELEDETGSGINKARYWLGAGDHNFDETTRNYIPLVTPFDDVAADYNLSGYSVYRQNGLDKFPMNILVEYLERDMQIYAIRSEGNVVTVTTVNAHGFKTGDAITITGIPTGTNNPHVLGQNDEHYNGSFIVTVLGNRQFRYVTEHYTASPANYTLKQRNCGNMRAERWVVDAYQVPDVLVTGVGIHTDHTTITVPTEYVHSLMCGDHVSIGTADGTVLLRDAMVTGTEYGETPESIVISLEYESIAAAIPDGRYSMFIPGRTPSGSVPANYDFASGSGYGSYGNNANRYAHMANTYMLTPTVDTYFSKNDHVNHTYDTSLLITPDTVACIKFAVPRALSGDDIPATIELHVDSSTFMNCTIGVYQMNSGRWYDSMTYADIQSFITDTAISKFTITTDGVEPSENPVYITIPSNIVKKWMMGYDGYPPSIALYVMDSGNPEVRICSKEGEYPEYLRISGGEDVLVNPPRVNIAVTPVAAAPGEIVRIDVTDGDEWSDYVFNHKVMFGDVEAEIITGDSDYLEVEVPEMPGKRVEVRVYRIGEDGKAIQVSNSAWFNVEYSGISRNVKLADKVRPGLSDVIVSRAAQYDRDLAYNGFTEVTDENALLQNVYTILLTDKGERMFNPNYGTTINSRIFSAMQSSDEVALLNECILAVERYEPRVTINPSLSRVVFDYDNNTVDITLAIWLPSGNNRYLTLTFANRGK